MNRWACLHDLNNYFKKKDLLGGLTEPEKAQLRSNIGVYDNFGEDASKTPIDVTSDTLYTMLRQKALVPGARYMIKDFQTIYTSNTGETWGNIINPSEKLTIIVVANSSTMLDPRVTVIGHEDWYVEFDITPKILEDGTQTKGTITYLRDTNGNSAFYDFKNIKFRRNNVDYYTFSEIENGVVKDSSELHNTKYNVLSQDCYNNVFLGDTYNNIMQPGCANNTFWKGCHNSVIGWESVNNTFHEAVRFTSGSLYNKLFRVGDTTLSTTITKTIHKVNDVDIVSFLDPITYSYQVLII